MTYRLLAVLVHNILLDTFLIIFVGRERVVLSYCVLLLNFTASEMYIVHDTDSKE